MSRRTFTFIGAALGSVLVLTMATTTVAGAQQTPAGSASRHVRKPVDWVALNPEFAGATFVSDPATCLGCHEDSVRTYDHTVHAAALKYAPGSAGGDCESCHGPRSEHVAEPTDALSHERMTAAAQSAICLQCHDGGARFGWKAGAHHAAEVSCQSCHVVMEKRSDRALLAQASSPQLCYRCHGETRAEMLKTSHHPVREGRMECVSCHNVHGSTEALLVKSTITETCVSCHTNKRGPFLWEHAPVREDCTTCHTPHGSNQRFLLATREPFLCLTCHSYGGHINLPRYNRTSNSYGNGCTNCHITTHGSNHPSGAKQTR
ncbi:MAG: DmsE family decaheme c-type cytochrome [Acidobacteria bacterium]|nr:DmsE family decaheme c-type cytochrome [Acidobacteriota bacterium]